MAAYKPLSFDRFKGIQCHTRVLQQVDKNNIMGLGECRATQQSNEPVWTPKEEGWEFPMSDVHGVVRKAEEAFGSSLNE